MRPFLKHKINCPQLCSQQFKQIRLCFGLRTKICKETEAERRFDGKLFHITGPATTMLPVVGLRLEGNVVVADYYC